MWSYLSFIIGMSAVKHNVIPMPISCQSALGKILNKYFETFKIIKS